MHKERENWRSSIHLENVCLENIIDKFERFSRNLMEKKKQGWVANKYEVSNVDAKIISVLGNIIDLQVVITFKRTSKMKSKITKRQIVKNIRDLHILGTLP